MKKRLPVESWDNDEWTCPYCWEVNDFEFWPSVVTCKKCDRKHKFETDYNDPLEGTLTIGYEGPEDEK